MTITGANLNNTSGMTPLQISKKSIELTTWSDKT